MPGTFTRFVATEITPGDLTLPQIAREVGYQSEAAFSRAFKKMAAPFVPTRQKKAGAPAVSPAPRTS
jgi:hypothetical protein